MTEFTIHRSELLPALTRADRVVPTRTTMPILSNAHIAVGKDGVRLTATDLEMTVTATAEPLTVKADGLFTVPLKLVRAFVSRLPESAEIKIAVDEREAKFTAGRARLSAGVLPAGDFPLRKDDDFDAQFALPGRDLAAIFDATGFAVSTEEARFYLQGVYFHCIDGRICGTATDGHKMAVHYGGEADGAQAMPDGFGSGADGKGLPGIIVPTRAVEELSRMGDEAGGNDIALSVNRLALRAAIDGWEVTSKIIDGTYPPYVRIVPHGHPSAFVAPVAEFTAAVERVLLAAGDKGDAIRLNFEAESVRLSGRSLKANNATEDEVPGKLEGSPVAIGFNGRYLASILAKVGTKGNVRFELADHASATRIQRDGDDDFFAVLMPLSLPKWE